MRSQYDLSKTRNTAETQLSISLADDNRPSKINTGVGFLDHMLTLFTFHSNLSITIEANGDTEVDDHHVTEDIGIVLGQLLLEMTRERKSFQRYGVSYIPMDETLARTVVDISGRPFLSFNAHLSREKVGTFDTELVEFFRALVINARLTTHIDLIRGGNTHHEIEGIFKSFARALKESLSSNDIEGTPSSKGVIE
ncbi:imidazoleglycerol-phosphate dehydratase HisB [Staphylococcus xylosus]|uniref:Imidazoleglycerol-phosphate dehydratase n=1 Tax=Staphylococcus xylosus TaxID=1288 RepID=A0A939NIF7_STAXY|nr:imidazoleglycerol-phosphate dehydratase HisB [Staphylococcus xylosus]